MKRKWMKKWTAILMAAAMIATLIPYAPIGAEEGSVTYIDATGAKQTIDTYTPVEYEVGFNNWTTGWYVVSAGKELTLPARIEVSGDVHLILEDGCKLTIKGGIHLTGDNKLTIYGQENSSGILNIDSAQGNCAGIGGNQNEDGGHLTINGGDLTVKGGASAAGIGGGSNGDGGTILINGQTTINARGGSINAAGIGGGSGGAGGQITINNCKKIYAQGNNAAGIGGGFLKNGGIITIHNGNVEAVGGGNGAGIGGANSSEGKIEITGGQITATGGSNGGAGIGGATYFSGREIIISGGIIHATGGTGTKNKGDGIGNGGGFSASSTDPNTFSTGTNGQAIIFATPGGDGAKGISDKSNTNDWQGIIFEGTSGQLYGNVTLADPLLVPENHTLTIPENRTLTIPENLTLTNEGTIDGSGTIKGIVKGTQPTDNVTVDTGKITITVSEVSSEIGTVTGGGTYSKNDTVTLTATPNAGYHFVGWQDENGVQSSTEPTYQFTAQDSGTFTAIFHQLTANNGQAASCTQAGTKPHWTCEQCSKTFADAIGTSEITDTALPLLNHTLIHHPEQPASCTEPGHIAYWQCTSCQAMFRDAQGTTLVTDVTQPHLSHDLTYQPATSPTYTSTGMQAHYRCAHCGKVFDLAQQETTEAALTLPALTPAPIPPSEPEQPEEQPPLAEISESAHGDVRLSPERPQVGDRVTIVPTPAAGYNVATVQLIDANDTITILSPAADGSFHYIQPQEKVRIVVTFAKKPLPFVDIEPNAWYTEPVQVVVDQGLMSGTSSTAFEPQTPTTRAMIVAILYRLAGEPTADATHFSDVDSDSWYAASVNWAASAGIVGGYDVAPEGDRTFRPNTPITREELASILYRYAVHSGSDVSARADLSPYSDRPSAWAIDVMSWANAEGLITGRTATTIDAQGLTTRAECAAILQRFLTK